MIKLDDLERTEFFLMEGLKSLNLTSTINTIHESDTEAWIELEGLGVSIFVDAEGTTRKRIGGGEVKGTEWQVHSQYYTAATREQPEETDMVIRRVCDTVADAVAEVFALVTREHILNMIESLGLALDFDLEAEACRAEREGQS